MIKIGKLNYEMNLVRNKPDKICETRPKRFIKFENIKNKKDTIDYDTSHHFAISQMVRNIFLTISIARKTKKKNELNNLPF